MEETKMAGILNKLMDFIGIEDTEYEEEYFDDEMNVAEENVLSLGNRGRKKAAVNGSNVVSLPTL